MRQQSKQGARAHADDIIELELTDVSKNYPRGTRKILNFELRRKHEKTTKTLCLILALMMCISTAAVYAEDIASGIIELINPTEIINPEDELQPMMAEECCDNDDDYSNILSGKPYVPEGCAMIRNDVAGVSSTFFIDFVVYTFGSFRSNEWKKHMETWEDDDGYRYECHYWQGPNGVTYYHN